MLKIWVGNLGAYNEGLLIGEWLSLPATQEEIESLYCRIKVGRMIDGEYVPGYQAGWSFYEEVFVADYESDIDSLKVGEYDRIDELNEIAEMLEELEDDQQIALSAMLHNGYEIEKAIDKAQNGDFAIYDECYTMADVAERYCDECGILNDIPESLRYYFDFEAYGRDMEIEGEYVYTGSGQYVEIF